VSIVLRITSNIFIRIPTGRISAHQLSVILPPNPEEPIRTELFSLERLEQHANSLATA